MKKLSMNELYKCPKCQDLPILLRVGDDKQFFACVCSDCGYTPIGLGEARYSPYSAMNLWNTKIELFKNNINDRS